jgi:photosystem II stability/assembly factor-like uncharacterized protein
MYDQQQQAASGTQPEKVGDNALLRAQWELLMLADPATGELPSNIRKKELRFAQRLERRHGMSTARMAESWKPRGPYNVGGRTRALAIDLDNENIILAGGVSGGMWRSEDGGLSWTKTTGTNENQSVSYVVQDPRPGQRNVWYYSSGERLGNSASGGGAFFGGSGIFKSTDGGRSWKLLNNTADEDPRFQSPFDIVFSLAIHPQTGDLYVGSLAGVFRSTNGGNSFEELLTAGFDRWAEVAITPNGQVYAAFDGRATAGRGIYRLINNTTWENLTPTIGLPATYGRMVLGTSPSQPNVLYALGDLNSSAILWRYTHDETGATPINNRWVNLSANLPTTIGGSVGNFNSQGGYNLMVKVHPTKPNIVFIGGTNLYRSTDGFATKVGQSSWIGGYSPRNNVSIYENQHPDQHNLVFYPSNPDRAISANDGGLHRAEDITMVSGTIEPVTWTSLNNGYLTTQPYALSFNPTGTDDQLIAGFQDNSTWYTATDNLQSPWIDLFSGDGSYNAIADDGLTQYVSSQTGRVYRFNYASQADAAVGNFSSFTRVQPAGASGFAFIAPFVLDPNDDNIMYMPAGGTMWRNSDLDGIPLFSNALATTNWAPLQNSTTVGNATITALNVSRQGANRLYYGTSNGQLYRIDNANLGDQPKQDIFSGKGLPTGFVSSIEVDPVNADRVFVVFSNYNINSVFYSEDGGANWTNISGNLEQNPDGTGNGPSVRWVAVKGNSDGYLLGTSTGLYSTTSLNGTETVWVQEDVAGIGNVVVPMVRTRADGFIAVATHGNGLYSGRFNVTPLPEAALTIARRLDNLILYKNAGEVLVDVTGVFEYSGEGEISYQLLNTNPAIVSAELDGNLLRLNVTPNATGSTDIALVATAGTESLSEVFTVSVREIKPSLVAQTGPINGTRPSQLFPDFGALAQSADDFTIPAGQSWSIEEVAVSGSYRIATSVNDVRVVIYQNDGGKPGAEVYSSGALVPANPASPNFTVKLPEALTLPEGTYWLSVYPNLAFGAGFQWYWANQTAISGAPAHFRDNANLFGTGAVNWTESSLAFGGIQTDMVFTLFGQGEGLAAPEAPSNLQATTVSDVVFNLTWEDNSTDELAFVVERSTDGVNFTARRTVAPNTTSFTDTDRFNASLTYSYRVAAVGNGSNSEYSNIASTAILPAAPKTLPAADYSSRSFVARWQPVVNASYYELQVSADGFETMLAGYDNLRVNGTEIKVTGTKSRTTYQYRVRAVNAGGASAYSNPIEASRTEFMYIIGVCSEEPEVERRWKVINPNSFEVQAVWTMYSYENRRVVTYTDSVVVSPGKFYFQTSTLPGFNLLFLSWQDDRGRTRLNAGYSFGQACAPGARTLADGSEDEVMTESPLFVQVWPNPIVNGKFQTTIAAPQPEQPVLVRLIDAQGKIIMQKEMESNIMGQEWDISDKPAGMYILRVEQGDFHRTIRIVND